MTRALFRGLGNLALLAASAAFLVSVSLLLFGSFLITWPILRKSPRERRMHAVAEMASAGLVLLSTFTKDIE